MNIGKIFEQQWHKNANKVENLLFGRFKDSPASYGSNNNSVRFTAENICDFYMYKYPVIFLLELKNTKGSSLPFSNIRENQLQQLNRVGGLKGVVAGVVINFSSKEKCYFLDIKDVMSFIESSDRKSIPLSYCEEKGFSVPMKKLRTRYDYDVDLFVKFKLSEWEKGNETDE